MYARKPRFRFWPLILVALLVAGALIGTAVGKYIYSQELKATVKFSAKLADTMVLEEHEAVRDSDGSYTLTDVVLPVKDAQGKVTDNENEYILIPGLDVPKDPYISITGKTPLESYLFLEVVDTLGSGNTKITYELEEHWVELAVTAQHGGKVYVYAKDGVAVKVTDQTEGLNEIGIILGDMVYVSQKLEKDAKDIGLTFFAAMGEIAVQGETTTSRTPEQVYLDTYND